MAEFAQPLCTAVQIGLVDLLQFWGVSPNAVLGHSSGEIAAAYAARAISAETAIIVAFYRGLMARKQTRSGGMAAVGIGRDVVADYLIDDVVIACENSPASVTISGSKTSLQAVVEKIKSEQPDVFVRTLRVEVAYHSREDRPLPFLYVQSK